MKNRLTLVLWGLFAGACNGLFGSGGGMIVVPILKKAGLGAHKAHSTAIAVILPLAVVSVVRYASFATIPEGILLPVCIGGTVGAWFGARFLKRFSARALSLAFGVVIVVSGLRMVIA